MSSKESPRRFEGPKSKGGQNPEPTAETLANRPPPPSGSGGSGGTCTWTEGTPDHRNVRLYTLACGGSLRLTRYDVMQFSYCPRCGVVIKVTCSEDRK